MNRDFFLLKNFAESNKMGRTGALRTRLGEARILARTVKIVGKREKKMVKILTDSTSDLSHELLERYGVDVIPLYVHLEEKEYKDGFDITPDEIIRTVEEKKIVPKTSAPSVDDVIEVYNRYPNSELVVFCISETMSASASVMRLAAEALDRTEQIFVVNSKNLSTGIGLLIIEASLMAQNGMPGKEIYDGINKLIPYVDASFVVDTLTYLHRGGRCSGIAAFAGTALKLHPQINLVDGVMVPGKKFRGNISEVIVKYVKEKEQDLLNARTDRVFITQRGVDESVVGTVCDYLKSLGHFKEVLLTGTGSVITAHCGPGTLGVLFLRQDSDKK